MSKKPTRPDCVRSRVSTGKTLFLPGMGEVDGRSSVARRFRDHVADLSVQVGGDPSPAQDMLIRRAATLAVLCETDEIKVAGGERIDEALYLNRCNVLSGLLNRLGMARKAKDITPGGRTLDAHARAILDGEA